MSDNEKDDNLIEAASEWQPDEKSAQPPKDTKASKNSKKMAAIKEELQAAAGPAIEPTPSGNPEGGNDYVAFIDEPFGIRTLEISEAQKSSEELELDEDLMDMPEISIANPEASDEQLENLARAIDEQNRELEAQAQVNSVETEAESQEELARQIAEDQALAAEVAREAAEAEKLLEMDPELLAALPKEPQPDEQGNLDLSELQSCIETLLFMLDKPTSTKKLKEWLGPDFKEGLFEQALEGLKARYQGLSHGIELVEIANGWQLRTKPGRAALAKKLSKIQTQRLSSGGMETLAIIAYRQPTMKEEIDKIRGVDSSYFVRGLLDKKLIAITGRSELPGRPMLYSTTDHFLELFGLKDLASMPSLRELEQMVPASQSKNPADEDPRIKEMRRLVDKMKSDTSTTLLYDPKEDEKILTEIRERVKAIPTSSPYLEEQKALEKAAKSAIARGEDPNAALPAGTQLGLEAEQPSGMPEGVTLHPDMADMPPPESVDEPEPSTDQV